MYLTILCYVHNMTQHKAVPNDSRYIPFTQQDYCCVPTSIQMIMYRNGVPLIPAEELGYYLGLTVPPEEGHLFYKARVSVTPPSGAGFGTQIMNPEYNPDEIFPKLGIPFVFSQVLAAEIADEADLLDRLHTIEQEDSDALLCFNHGVIKGEYKPFTGHVVVFDRVIDGKIRVVDASWKHPKWRLVEPSLMLEAIQCHGDKNSGGIWHFRLK
jgi:hypothetical protein